MHLLKIRELSTYGNMGKSLYYTAFKETKLKNYIRNVVSFMI